MPLDRAQATDDIIALVLSGFYDTDDILEIIAADDNFTPADAAWTRKVITRAQRQEQAEERTWPRVTDCYRLDRAFIALDQAGIIALHNAGVVSTDTVMHVAHAYARRGGPSSDIIGWCCYTFSSVEVAIGGGGLGLGFGAIDGDRAGGTEIGHRIVAELERQGLTTIWDGNVEHRIAIHPFEWRRRGP
jgi:hypothetical protein